VSYAIRTGFAKKKSCLAELFGNFFDTSCDLVSECFMLYKYRPAAVITRPTAKSMPQLDFREALSNPDERLFSSPATVAAASAVPLDKKTNIFAHGVGFSRSTLTNIFFVAIASIGGLACAFYFFNGGELLRAAAAWPSEFLYPRPLSAERVEVATQLTPVDTFASNEPGLTKTDEAKARSEKNTGPSDFSQPATTLASNNPAVTTPAGSGSTVLPTGPSLPATPSLPVTPSLPPAPSAPSGLGLPSTPDIDSLFQPLDQKTPVVAPKKAIARTTNTTRTSSRRKPSSTQQRLTSRTKSAITTQSMQQASNQTQAPMNSIQTSSAMGMGGGLGTGLGGAMGGVSGSLGGGLGGLGGTASGILGGHH
jgi:hypothetical protein